mgnify:CR=1 FL=1
MNLINLFPLTVIKDKIEIAEKDRNGLIGTKVPSHLSPWIANGCLSPRTIYNNIQNLVSKTFMSASTNMFIMELLWRDFFQFQCLSLLYFSPPSVFEKKRKPIKNTTKHTKICKKLTKRLEKNTNQN